MASSTFKRELTRSAAALGMMAGAYGTAAHAQDAPAQPTADGTAIRVVADPTNQGAVTAGATFGGSPVTWTSSFLGHTFSGGFHPGNGVDAANRAVDELEAARAEYTITITPDTPAPPAAAIPDTAAPDAAPEPAAEAPAARSPRVTAPRAAGKPAARPRASVPATGTRTAPKAAAAKAPGARRAAPSRTGPATPPVPALPVIDEALPPGGATTPKISADAPRPAAPVASQLSVKPHNGLRAEILDPAEQAAERELAIMQASKQAQSVPATAPDWATREVSYWRDLDANGFFFSKAGAFWLAALLTTSGFGAGYGAAVLRRRKDIGQPADVAATDELRRNANKELKLAPALKTLSSHPPSPKVLQSESSSSETPWSDPFSDIALKNLVTRVGDYLKAQRSKSTTARGSLRPKLTGRIEPDMRGTVAEGIRLDPRDAYGRVPATALVQADGSVPLLALNAGETRAIPQRRQDTRRAARAARAEEKALRQQELQAEAVAHAQLRVADQPVEDKMPSYQRDVVVIGGAGEAWQQFGVLSKTDGELITVTREGETITLNPDGLIAAGLLRFMTVAEARPFFIDEALSPATGAALNAAIVRREGQTATAAQAPTAARGAGGLRKRAASVVNGATGLIQAGIDRMVGPAPAMVLDVPSTAAREAPVADGSVIALPDLSARTEPRASVPSVRQTGTALMVIETPTPASATRRGWLTRAKSLAAGIALLFTKLGSASAQVAAQQPVEPPVADNPTVTTPAAAMPEASIVASSASHAPVAETATPDLKALTSRPGRTGDTLVILDGQGRLVESIGAIHKDFVKKDRTVSVILPGQVVIGGTQSAPNRVKLSCQSLARAAVKNGLHVAAMTEADFKRLAVNPDAAVLKQWRADYDAELRRIPKARKAFDADLLATAARTVPQRPVMTTSFMTEPTRFNRG